MVMVSAQLWDWSRMEGLEVFNAWRSLSRHPKPHRIPLICSHGLYQPQPRRPWSTAKIKQHCCFIPLSTRSLLCPSHTFIFFAFSFSSTDHLKMEGDLLSMASTQRLKLFQGSQAFPSNLHLHLLSKLGILRNLGDKESWFWILYRAKQDGPVVLGWRHPWEGHGDHSHDHVPEDKVL
ncbi:hypothetical protein ZIOFF_013866 [Zingiber officinale]|uniref:Uncharacterized protein n=1 Tax=Zingiber officinale TaxID=94328 RepID=A0A8J5HGL0_ZINOF|nr:hypothetical protein ZIOFF_013866 [Zingiber officinale]